MSLVWSGWVESFLACSVVFSPKGLLVSLCGCDPCEKGSRGRPAVSHSLSLTVFQSGQFSEDMIPTVGFNMRKITKGNVTIKVGICILFLLSAAIYLFHFILNFTQPNENKCQQSKAVLMWTVFCSQLWDIGGQPRFRSMWERYCRGVSAIV